MSVITFPSQIFSSTRTDLRPWAPGPPLFFVFVFSLPPTPLGAPGPALTERLKTLGLADDTPAPLAYVRLSSITDVHRRYVRTVKTGTYIHASTTLRLKFSLRLAPLAAVRKSRSSHAGRRRLLALILALIYAENPAGAAAVALGPNVSLAVHQRRVLVRDLLGHTFGVAVVPPSVVMPSATRSL